MKHFFSLIFFLGAIQAWGNTYWVTSVSNSGAGSLRSAAAATVNTAGDTIRFHPNLLNNGSVTITVSSPINLGEVVLIGLYNATDTVYVSGGGTSRVFTVQDYQIPFAISANQKKRTTIDSICVKDGYKYQSGGGYGGGIFFGGSTPTSIPSYRYMITQELIVKNSVFKNNYANSKGGAISISSSGVGQLINKKLEVHNSKFENNDSHEGGAIGLTYYVASGSEKRRLDLTVIGCFFYRNSSVGEGSAILVQEGSYFSSSASRSIVTSVNTSINKSTFYRNTGGQSVVRQYTSRSRSNCSVRTSTFTNNAGRAVDFRANSSFEANLNIINSTLMQGANYYASPFNPYHGNTGFYHKFKSISSIILGGVSSNPSQYYTPTHSIFSSSGLNLGPLQDNGGTTLTRLPMWGSTAINAGNPSDFSSAQNGFIRDARRDVGAAEFDCGHRMLIDSSICYGDTIYWGSQVATTAGAYFDTLTNVMGCDSILVLLLNVSNSTSGVDAQTACDTYTWIDGNTYTSSNNTATHTLTNAAGCDSVVTLNLTILNSTSGVDAQTACDTYTWIDGNTYTSSNNTATHTLTNAAGCDSVVTLNLTILNSTSGVDAQTACDTYTWIDGNVYTSSNNTATHTLTNAAGCDSVVTLNLTILNSTSGVDAQTACDTYTWIDGNTYTSSNNTATHTLTNAAGCDSVVTLNLTILNSTSGVDAQTACDTYTWIDGNTYTSSNNTATHTLTNAAGCDSVVTLNLTILNSTSGVDAQTACDTYTWIDGNVYTSSNNTATHTLTNAAGCDSVVTLNLTILNSTSGVDAQTACDTYTWIDGNTYTSSNNTATHTLTNAAGCDSVVTLNLTILNSTSGVDAQTACDTYTWIDGNVYTSSNNTATHTLTNAAGCDSVVTLNLTILNSTSGVDAQTACDTYTWIDGNTYTSSNNTATHTLTNAAGCDSVVTLNLTILNSTSGVDVQTACDTYTWIDGNTYTSSNNTATHTLTNAAGCDSVVTLNLTILNSTSGVDAQTACDTYTWIDGNVYTSSNNTATHTLTNAAGCDSVVTLNLTITNLDVTVAINGTTLIANQAGVNYQWINCDSLNVPIAGATNQSFVPTSNGNYAVILSNTNCVDTSNCVNFTNLSIGTIAKETLSFKIYPTPTKDYLTIELKSSQDVAIEILDINGRVLLQQAYQAAKQIELPVERLITGVYFVKVETKGNVQIVKMIKE
ncbi:T9SS type A sorting domain-containing protein [Aureispira anguillae]|uniref:T9SS type A sorting domain-containing protein n=1 Tax=Aureispira anguillae TaxID=2864201 RepID=A0A915YDR2_9BACT|nr:T9SS type A sorting domain-containing protein [Aureispira anguillae]BDS11213.1 T9SS type A sorting domain-containing protein [Aureispira anguillae]